MSVRHRTQSHWAVTENRRQRERYLGGRDKPRQGIISKYRRKGLIDNALASPLQREGVASFVESWRTVLARIDEKGPRRPV